MHLNHVSCVHLHLVQRTYFWHFTNPRHTVKTGYVIPILPGVSRVPYGDTVFHVNDIVGLPGIPEAVRGKHRRFQMSGKGDNTLNNLHVCYLTIILWGEVITSILSMKKNSLDYIISLWDLPGFLNCHATPQIWTQKEMIWTVPGRCAASACLPHASLTLFLLLGHPSLCREANLHRAAKPWIHNCCLSAELVTQSLWHLVSSNAG